MGQNREDKYGTIKISDEVVSICAVNAALKTKGVHELSGGSYESCRTSYQQPPATYASHYEGEDNRSGVIRHVLIRTSRFYDEVMVVIVSNVDAFPSRNNFVKELTKRFPNIKTIVQNINTRDTNVILGEKERILYGPGFIKDEILGVSFLISSKSFFQVNPYQVEKLYSKAFELAELDKNDVILDAYSGVGTIGLIASKKVKKVYSVETVHSAIINAKENAKRNNIDNIEIIEADCSEYLNTTNKKFDVVIMDPPRKGSDEIFLSALKKNSPKKIVYISCNPATLARDLSFLLDKYEIKTVQPVDMFPRSFHVETILLLCRKDAKNS